MLKYLTLSAEPIMLWPPCYAGVIIDTTFRDVISESNLYIAFVLAQFKSFPHLTFSSAVPSFLYRVIHEVLPPLREGIPEVIWNKKC
jgi:hypothetical protein